MQKVDALVDLRLDDPRIDRDAKILEIIKGSARRLIANPRLRTQGGKRPSLYYRYRGKGFPLQKRKGLRIPSWRGLTPWMKVQLATLALAERGYMQFKLHLHDDLWAKLVAEGRDPKDYLRDSISRHLQRRFPQPPCFFFVMEDLTKKGHPTRPHAHGSIEVRRAPLPEKGPGSRRLRMIERTEGLAKAEVEAGKALLVTALKAAGGGSGSRFAKTTGADQCRNLWHRRPYHPIFNSQWGDYAFKHWKSVKSTLGDNRLALPNHLRGEAKRLWRLLTCGEPAVDQWDDC